MPHTALRTIKARPLNGCGMREPRPAEGDEKQTGEEQNPGGGLGSGDRGCAGERNVEIYQVKVGTREHVVIPAGDRTAATEGGIRTGYVGGKNL